MRSKRTKLLLGFVSTAWIITVGAGLTVLLNYENTPGTVAAAPSYWPAQTIIQPATNTATLVMMVHPHCPCTRASVSELARLMAQAQGQLTAYVLFTKPASLNKGWEQTDLWATASAIPGVSVMRDDDGAEARRFNATTSGQTMLYGAEGNLLFSGGITGGRGHEGDNAGRSAIISLLTRSEAECNQTPVFGCSLFAGDACEFGKEVSHGTDNK